MRLQEQVLVTGGAGFLGSHLSDRLIADGRSVLCVDNFYTGTKPNIHHLLDDHRFRADAPRRDLPALRPGRLDLQPRLPGLAGPLPARPDPDDQDQRPRRDQHAGPRQAPELPDLPGLDQRGLRRSGRAPADRSPTGATSIPIGPRSCYDEGKRCAETLFFDYHRQAGLDIKVGRIFNTYGPRMHPDDGRVVSNFIVQALRGEPITIYGDGSQTRSFCYVSDLIEAFVRFMDTGDRLSRPDEPRQSRRDRDRRTRREGRRDDRIALQISYRPLPRTTRSSASPTSRSPARSSAGSRTWRSRTACARPSPISRPVLRQPSLSAVRPLPTLSALKTELYFHLSGFIARYTFFIFNCLYYFANYLMRRDQFYS